MTESRILERVRKLLALANDEAATEGERDNALRMAHATLMKHQLTLEHLDAHQREQEDPRERLDTEGWNLVWCRDVRNAIAKLFFCKYLIGRKINATKGVHVYVGRASNVATAAYMSDFVIQGILREADKRYKHRLTPEGRSFCVGVAARLWERVVQMQESKEVQAEVTASGSALVVADYYKTEADANAAWIAANLQTQAGKARKQAQVKWGAYSAGHEHGNSISLNQQVSTTAAPKQIS